MRIAVFKQKCHVELSEGKKILVLSPEKTEAPEDEGTESFVDKSQLVLKGQEVGNYNENQKKMVLSFLPPAKLKEGKKPEDEDAWDNEHEILLKYIVQ